MITRRRRREKKEKKITKWKTVCHCFLTDSIVSNLISNRKLTANDECTFLILLIYFCAPGVSSAPGVYLLAVIATALTKRTVCE